MKKIRSQKGQALILIALAVVGLVSFSALAIDGGRVLSDRRHAQNTADTSVLAAALAKIKGDDYVQAAKERATNNGYTTGVDNAEVIVVLCSDPSLPADDKCQGIDTTASSEYIRVRIHSFVPTTFARVLGRTQVENTVEAIARVQGSSSTSGSALFNGSAMVATSGQTSGKCFDMNGNTLVTIHGSGLFINCSSPQALYMNSNANIVMDAQGKVVGSCVGNPPYDYDDTQCNATGEAQTIDGDDFADVPTLEPTPTCTGNGDAKVNGVTIATGSPPNVTVGNGKTATFSPGNFGSIIADSNASAVFNPGVYCVSGTFNFNSNNQVTGPSGLVQFVLQNQSLNISAGTTLDFDNLEIYGNGASFTFNSGTALHAERLRFYSKGGGNFTVNSGGEVTSPDAYFYFHSGNIIWNADSILNLHSPTEGDYAGLLIHKPWTNNSQINFNAGTDIYLSGTFLTPRSPVNFNSKVGFELHSQIIAYTYTVNAQNGGSIDIYYQADENYGGEPPASPTIELTK
jgi:hypothetical protein